MKLRGTYSRMSSWLGEGKEKGIKGRLFEMNSGR